MPRVPENEIKADKGFMYGSRESREKLRAKNAEKIEEMRLWINLYSEIYEFEKAACLLQTTAELGDDDSLVELCDCYYYGVGVQRDAEKAKEILQQVETASTEKKLEEIKQIERMDAEDLYEMAIWEFDRPHFRETYTEMARSRGLSDEWYTEQMEICGEKYKKIGLDAQSKDCYLKAAESGSVNAMLIMGYLNCFGDTGEDGIKEAEKWYQRAADKGNTEALDYLSQIQGARELIENISDNVEMMADYGEMLKMDPGVGNYKIKAFLLLREAAKLGDRYAKYHIAEMYEEGNGVDQDLMRAFDLYEELAENGDVFSQYALGKMYEDGRGVTRDMQKAVIWYEKAAVSDDDFGAPQLALADIYYDGAENVPKNLEKAAYWYNEAALNKMRRAQERISEMYQKGIGVKKDKKLAKHWKKKAENWSGY